MLNIKKVTYLKVGYFLLPTAALLFGLLYIEREFYLALFVLPTILFSYPLGTIAMHAINFLPISGSLPFDNDTNKFISEVGIIIYLYLVLYIGYIQWFIIVPKLWHLIFTLNFWPFNVMNHESTLIRVGLFLLTVVVIFYMIVSGFHAI